MRSPLTRRPYGTPGILILKWIFLWCIVLSIILLPESTPEFRIKWWIFAMLCPGPINNTNGKWKKIAPYRHFFRKFQFYRLACSLIIYSNNLWEPLERTLCVLFDYSADKDQKRTMSVNHKTRSIINFINYQTKTINTLTKSSLSIHTIEFLWWKRIDLYL